MDMSKLSNVSRGTGDVLSALWFGLHLNGLGEAGALDRSSGILPSLIESAVACGASELSFVAERGRFGA